MATRPCKPGADVKRIWQWLLPQTPFPGCGAPDDALEPKPEAKPATDKPHAGEAPRE